MSSKEEPQKDIQEIRYLVTDTMYMWYLWALEQQADLIPPRINPHKFKIHCIQTLELAKTSNLQKYILDGFRIYSEKSEQYPKDKFFIETNRTNRVDINNYPITIDELTMLENLILDCIEFYIKNKKIPNIVDEFMSYNIKNIDTKNIQTPPKFINITFEDEKSKIKLEKPYELISILDKETESYVINLLQETLKSFVAEKNFQLSTSYLQKLGSLEQQLELTFRE